MQDSKLLIVLLSVLLCVGCLPSKPEGKYTIWISTGDSFGVTAVGYNTNKYDIKDNYIEFTNVWNNKKQKHQKKYINSIVEN